MKKVEPQVRLVARPQVDYDAIADYLEDTFYPQGPPRPSVQVR